MREPQSETRTAPAQGDASTRRDHGDGQAGVVRLGDGRLIATRRWPGRGLPIVALHGLFDCSLGWKHVAAGATRPCLAFDLPGFGRSSMPLEAKFAAYAQDILAALDHLGVESFSLVGHSLGGAVAAWLSEQAPERTVNLTLLAPAGFSSVPLAEMLQGNVVGRVVRRGIPLALSNPMTAAGIYMALVARGRPPERQLLGRVMRRSFSTASGALAANEAIVAAARDPDGFAHRPVAYDGRVSVLWGAGDLLIPSGHAEHVSRALPQASVTVWNGMGHHPQRERPAELNDYLAAATRAGTKKAVRRRAAAA